MFHIHFTCVGPLKSQHKVTKTHSVWALGIPYIFKDITVGKALFASL